MFDNDRFKVYDPNQADEPGEHYLSVFCDEGENPVFLVRDDGPDGEYKVAAVEITREDFAALVEWFK